MSQLSYHRVTSLSFEDESEIVWSKFPDPGWNRWSAYQLRRKWQALKRSVSGHENLAPRGEYTMIGCDSRPAQIRHLVEIAHAILQGQQ
jgi:hypothetical protein